MLPESLPTFTQTDVSATKGCQIQPSASPFLPGPGVPRTRPLYQSSTHTQAQIQLQLDTPTQSQPALVHKEQSLPINHLVKVRPLGLLPAQPPKLPTPTCSAGTCNYPAPSIPSESRGGGREETFGSKTESLERGRGRRSESQS